MIKLRQIMEPNIQLLTRGIDTVYPTKETLSKALESGKKLTLYQGFDPSGAHLHIGHAVGLRKLRQFQDLGHKVIFLIGDFTGMIGDPSGKKDARKPLTKEQVLENAKDYKNQAQKILRFDGDNPVEIKFNSEWNSKLNFEDVIKLAANFSVQQMLERDMFQTRIKEGREINLVEFLYPLIQGYDSVAMNVDIEVGGTDQTFNMLQGRILVERLLNKQKFVLTVPLLTDSKGTKIGKSEGNVIGLTDAPSDFYGKIMSLGDDSIIPCFTLLTDTSDEDIEKMKTAILSGENPMTFKKKLAFELTKWLNTEDDARKAEEQFKIRFQERDIDKAELPMVKESEIKFLTPVQSSGATVLDYVTSLSLADSNSEARRLVNQGSVSINNTVVKIQKRLLLLRVVVQSFL